MSLKCIGKELVELERKEDFGTTQTMTLLKTARLILKLWKYKGDLMSLTRHQFLLVVILTE